METAAYGFLKGIDYVTEECPMSLDATSLVFKEALSLLEEKMPGTRMNFYQGFLQGRERRGTKSIGTFLNFSEEGPAAGGEENAGGAQAKCALCGAPSYAETCAFCRLKEKVGKGGRR
jgi:tRNA(Ile)-lysidine synthase TilS/MesJ